MTQSKKNKFDVQASQYVFPYHYLPAVDESGAVSLHKDLSWGLDYLTYMSFVANYITDVLKANSLLDVGCGDGRLLSMLLGKVPKLTGVDLAEQAVLFARAFNPHLTIHLKDVSDIPGKFDVLTLIEVMEHIPDDGYPDFVNRVAEKLEQDGRLLVSVPTTNTPLNKKHYRHYDLALLSEQLSSRFCIEDFWYLTKQGLRYSILSRLLKNRLMIVTPKPWRRLIWRLYKNNCYTADENNGLHLVALAKLK